MKVAFVGLGSMGAPQARLLARAGQDLSVYDPYGPALEAFRGIARLSATPAEAAEGAEAIGVCVRDDQQVEDVIFGPGGLAETMAEGTLLLIHSTISIALLKSLDERLAPRGVTVADAAVSRTRRTDDEPYVAVMLGGDEATISRARDVVAAYATDVIHAGPLGAGLALKIANNFVTWVHLVVGTQARDLAAANGVSIDALRELMTANGNLTLATRGLYDTQQRPANPERDAFMASQAGIGEKDLALAISHAVPHALDTRLAEAARSGVRAAMTART